jgi:choline dehydrogenase
MIYSRGNSGDYDNWAQLLQDDSWKWSNVLPFFKRHQKLTFLPEEEAAQHGREGEWEVSRQRLKWDILTEFEKACNASGIASVDDFNREDSNFGVGMFHVNQKDGFRLNAKKAFLSDYNSAYLTIETQQTVAKVLFDTEKRCVGVQLEDGGKRLLTEPDGEVILAAGSLGSSMLLELSGIGNPEILRPLGIDVLVDNREVGENLKDHLQMRHVFKVDHPTLNTKSRRLSEMVSMFFQYLFSRSGPLSMAPSQLGVYCYSDTVHPEASREKYPNVQYHVQPLSLAAFGEPLHKFDAFTAAICNLRPKSTGSVHISGPSFSKDLPLIRPNYLSHPDDQKVAVESIKLTRQIVARMKKELQVEEVLPGTQYQTEEELVEAAGMIGTTIFHPVATCAMGKVVDSDLRVMQVKNLRVCDGSVMPDITSGNTASPILMMAEVLAHKIKNQ